jgi:ATP-dependent Clp protease ATP-binding subunit ClpC
LSAVSVSEPARQVLARAQEEARSLRHSYIGTEHILLALLDQPDCLLRSLLEARGVTHDAVRAKVVRMMGTGVVVDPGTSPFTARGQTAVDVAREEAAALRDREVGPDHLLVALVRAPSDASARILFELDVDAGELRDEVLRSRGTPSSRA